VKRGVGEVVGKLAKLTPSGLGSSATQKSWSSSLVKKQSYIEPRNFAEKLAMDEILANPSLGTKTKLPPLNDPVWKAWLKHAYSRRIFDKGVEYKVEIHFNAKIVDGVMQAIDDFKFVIIK